MYRSCLVLLGQLLGFIFVAFLPLVMQLLGFRRTVASFLLEQFCIFVFFNRVAWIFARLDEKLHGEGGQIVFHKGYSSFSHVFFSLK